jgi:hypothetical protein
LIGRDDTLISNYGLTTAGGGHTTEKVIRGNNDGLPIEAFIHRWKTQRTETYTDSEGRTRTRTVTENHSEIISAVTIPFCADFAHEFFSRVPSFVWKDLQITPPAFRRMPSD